MDYKYIDCHTHVNFAAFSQDYKEVIERALKTGVRMINVGTQKDTSLRAIELTKEFPEGVYATIGLHPVHTAKSYHDSDELGGDKGFTSRGEIFDFEYYRKLAMESKVVAIGECGLDYYRLSQNESSNPSADEEQEFKDSQAKAFIAQIELSHEVKKPLMIHCRQAYEDLIKILNNHKPKLNNPPGIMHFFAGGKTEAEAFLDMGFYFTFGGVITFVRDYDKVIKFIPADRILSETDAPYVTPVPYRGKRNEPAYVTETVRKLAELKDMEETEMAERIKNNARAALGI